MTVASRVNQLVQELGRIDAAWYAVHRALEWASGRRARIVRYRLVAQPIGASTGKPLRPDAATAIVPVLADDPLVTAFPRPAAVLACRWAAGARCTAARLRGEFAGFIWIQRGHYDEDEVRCRYVLTAPALSAWDFDVYVEPRFRAGRTMARLWGHVDAELAASGVRWSFSRISAFNPGSRAAHARLGTVDRGSATFVVLGRWQLALLGGFPFVHLSAGEGRAPVISLSPPSR